MQKSNAPTIITVPFASGASASYRNTIPIPSQIPITPGLASWTDGFPPLTMTQPGAGGIPPYGQDMNGLGFALSTINQWTQLGFVAAYSSSVSSAIGGYPAGACIGMLNGLGYWLSTADNNTTNPDATGPTNWVAIRANAGKSTITVASGTVTPDPSVLGAPLLVLSGTLTANVTLVLPLTAGAGWEIYNGTTGAFTVTVQGATGSGVTATQGSLVGVRTDGANYYTGSVTGGPFLPLHGTADAATKWATPRSVTATGDVAWNFSIDGSVNVTLTTAIQNGAVSLAKMANLTGNTLLGNPTGAAAAPSAIPLTAPLVFTGGSLALSYSPVNKAGDTMTGALGINTSSSGAANLVLTNTASGGNGAQIQLNGNGSTTPNKTLRVLNGLYQIVNSANSAIIQSLDDVGNLSANSFVGSASNVVLASNGSGGTILLRPNGLNTTTNQVVVDTNGNGSFPGYVLANNSVQTPSTLTNAIGPYSGATQGFQFLWNNIAGGSGRNEYVNNFGGGSGGHYFYTRSLTTGSPTLVFSVDASGNANIPGNCVVTGYAGANHLRGANGVIGGDTSLTIVPVAPIDAYCGSSIGRTLLRAGGSGPSIDAVNAANTAFVAQYFTATSHNFANQVNAPSFNVTSDLTLKNVLNQHYTPRDIASSVPLIAYTLKDDAAQRVHVGLGAQTVQGMAAEHVNPRPDGKLGLDYAAIAIEQSWSNRARLVALERRVAELEARKVN